MESVSSTSHLVCNFLGSHPRLPSQNLHLFFSKRKETRFQVNCKCNSLRSTLLMHWMGCAKYCSWTVWPAACVNPHFTRTLLTYLWIVDGCFHATMEELSGYSLGRSHNAWNICFLMLYRSFLATVLGQRGLRKREPDWILLCKTKRQLSTVSGEGLMRLVSRFCHFLASNWYVMCPHRCPAPHL